MRRSLPILYTSKDTWYFFQLLSDLFSEILTNLSIAHNPNWFISFSPRSPMSCLPLLFDQRDGLGTGVRNRPENVPPASSHIELLLEKHGNGEMGINSEWHASVLSKYLDHAPGLITLSGLEIKNSVCNVHNFTCTIHTHICCHKIVWLGTKIQYDNSNVSFILSENGLSLVLCFCTHGEHCSISVPSLWTV